MDSSSPTQADYDVEVFYDGDCPLCMREINLLRRLDKRNRIRFTNIAAESFQPAAVGKTMDELMAEIHGRLPDGTLVDGVEVFRRLYSAVGWGWVVAPTRLPLVRQGLDLAYRFFARYRLRLTGRCDAHCKVPSSNT